MEFGGYPRRKYGLCGRERFGRLGLECNTLTVSDMGMRVVAWGNVGERNNAFLRG